MDRTTLHSSRSEDASPPLGIPGGEEGEEAGEEGEEEDTDSCHTIQEQGRASVTLARLCALCCCFKSLN